MTLEELAVIFDPIVDQIFDSCALTDSFTDKEMFQIYIATIWGNAVLEPQQAGIDEDDLSLLHDYLNEVIQSIMGPNATVTSCFEFLQSQTGEDSMIRFQLTRRHRDFLNYFTNLILSTR
ncbi:MAG: hypothetical protein QGD92_09575 [Gammaproteobacteria bacterium]|nr:hypothetical protein [Gammaproteobacteria bacterium]